MKNDFNKIFYKHIVTKPPPISITPTQIFFMPSGAPITEIQLPFLHKNIINNKNMINKITSLIIIL